MKYLEMLIHNLHEEQNRWFLWVPVFFGIGVGVYFSLTFELNPRLTIAATLIALLVCVFSYFKNSKLYFPICCITLIFLGFATAQYRTHSLDTLILSQEIGPRFVKGIIENVEFKENALRVTLYDLSFEKWKKDRNITFPNKIRITIRGKLIPKDPMWPGEEIYLPVVLIPPSPPVMPGAYNFRQRAYFQGIGGVGYATKSPQVTETIPETSIAKIRQNLTTTFRTKIQGSAGGIAAALVTGDRTGIPDDLRQSFADSGLAHILAISGLHLSIIAGLMFFIFRRLFCFIPYLALNLPIKKWAAFISILATFGYLLICWGSVPALRAFLMTAIIMIGIIVDRTALSMRNVAFAAMVILVFYPEAMMGPSFQLSFAAVVGLIAAYESNHGNLIVWRSNGVWWKTILLYVFGIAATTFIASLATTPFCVHIFNRFTLHGIAANMIAIPLTTFWIMPAATLCVIATFFNMEDMFIPILSKGIELLIDIANTVSNWPGSVILVPQTSTSAFLLMLGGGLWICLWKKSWRWFGVVPIAASLASLAFNKPADIYINGEGKLIGINHSNGFLVTSTRTAKFASKMWAQKAGKSDILLVKDNLHCKDETCWMNFGENKYLTFSSSNKEFSPPQCANIIINLANVNPHCPNSRIINLEQLKSVGAHLIWLDDKDSRIINVSKYIGQRPWG